MLTTEQLARKQALGILAELRRNDCEGKFVLASDLERVYPTLCDRHGWELLAWRTVAVQLRQLTGGDKTYQRFGTARLRVYRVPPR